MDLKVNHPCPSCGAPISMAEIDRLTTCRFCDVQNYMVASGMLRYVLPDTIPEEIPREEVIYFPYVRFKGNIFSCLGEEFHHSVLDTTYQGIFTQEIPPSLGLRPQAMKLNAAHTSHLSTFIRRKETPMNIMQRASKIANRAAKGRAAPLYHRAFIGEIISYIYLPLYVKQGEVYDGVVNRPLGKAPTWLTHKALAGPYRPEWIPRFIASICPQCGAAMKGSSESQILYCFNCHCCCTEQNGSFIPVPHQVVKANSYNSILLPFWKLNVTSNNIQSMADFLRITNQPVVIASRHVKQPLAFWIPAFKVRPKAFLQLAKSATLVQMDFPKGNKELTKPLFPVTLPQKEAAQAMKSVLATTTLNKKDLMPQLPTLNFNIQQSELFFLPFTNEGHDLVQQHTGISIASSILHFGRKQ